MRALAWSYIWWLKMDQEIEDIYIVKRYSVCQENRALPTISSSTPMAMAESAMEQTSFGSVYVLLIIADTCSKCRCLHHVHDHFIKDYRNAQNGICNSCITANDCLTDNSSSLMSKEFKRFWTITVSNT